MTPETITALAFAATKGIIKLFLYTYTRLLIQIENTIPYLYYNIIDRIPQTHSRKIACYILIKCYCSDRT